MKKICRITATVSELLATKPEGMMICSEQRKAGWRYFPCPWCKDGIVQEDRFLHSSFKGNVLVAKKGDTCKMCYGTGRETDKVTTLPCGCKQRTIQGRTISKCALHRLGRYACCTKAKRVFCVCEESFDCPVHGKHCHGTHD